MDIAQLVITSLLVAIGLYLAHSLRRQQRLRVAERRLDAYAKFWALSEIARPTRVKDVSVDRQGPLTPQEARDLYNEMTHWYFGSGGLLLPDATKKLYLEVKKRLGAYAESGDSPSEVHGRRRIEELGLLRNQMRLDLDIYSIPYLKTPIARERELLEAAQIDPEGWGTPPWRTRIADQIRQLTRHATMKLPPRAQPIDEESP